MKLLTKELLVQLPPLYSTEEQGDEAKAHIKFFTPWSDWTWYATEGSPVDEDGLMDTDKEKVDFLFFGLVSGHELELGYFSLSEFENTNTSSGIRMVERDLYFKPTTIRELKERHQGDR